MLQHTSQNTKSFWNNFECEETDCHFLFPFVLFRAIHFFCINCPFFSSTPFISWWPHSSTSTWKQLLSTNGLDAFWYFSFIHMPLSPSFIIFAMCVIVCSNSVVSSSDLLAELPDFASESKNLSVVLLLWYGRYGHIYRQLGNYHPYKRGFVLNHVYILSVGRL